MLQNELTNGRNPKVYRIVSGRNRSVKERNGIVVTGRTARCGLFFFDVIKFKILDFPDIVWKFGLIV